MSAEIHTSTRQKLLPDPDFDPVMAVFYVIHNDVPSEVERISNVKRKLRGVIYQSAGDKDILAATGISEENACRVANEKSLFQELVNTIQVRSKYINVR